jgi:hypothetical protein
VYMGDTDAANARAKAKSKEDPVSIRFFILLY